MKILLVNKFLYPKGGDAISTINTGKLLSAKNHKVIFWGMEHPLNPKYLYKDYFVSYVDFNSPNSIKNQIKIALNLLYSLEAKKKIENLINIEKPDIVHLNNFAHQISPSILHVLKKYDIPTVMTMRDYKLVCPVYTMLSDSNPCEKCRDSKYYQCLINICTKNSRFKSMLNTAEMYLHHKILHIYDLIQIFIAPSLFLKNKTEEMGLKGKIVFLPNFVNVEDFKPEFNWKENSIVYFGRLSGEKGLFILIEAMKGVDVNLKIIGEGPLKERLELKVEGESINNVCFLGYKSGENLKNEIKKSMFVVLSSEWYENNPRTVLETFALGKPVIGSRIGGIPELVKDGETGLTFETGSADDLRKKILYLINNPHKAVKMGKNARKFVEEKFNPEKHYQRLMEIYNYAISKHFRG